MRKLELMLFWTTGGLYMLTFISALFFTIMRKELWSKIALWVLRTGCIVHLVLFVLRWYIDGHLPFGEPALGTVLILVILQLISKNDLTYIALFTTPIAVYALFSSVRNIPVLSAAYNSRWLFTHVVFAWFAFGSYATTTGYAIVYLVKTYKKDSLPAAQSLEKLDMYMYKLVILGLMFHAVMLIAGSIWANKLYGRYWGWDPLEVWSFIAFSFYTLYVHARLLMPVKGKVAAWLAVFGMLLLIISFWGVAVTRHFRSPAESLVP